MRNIIEFYNRLVSALKTVLPNDFVRSSLNGYPFEPWSKEKLLGRHPKGWRSFLRFRETLPDIEPSSLPMV